ncbi:MAG: ATP-grasp domain-containing protein, partial [Planctomycetaceae bacterium]
MSNGIVGIRSEKHIANRELNILFTCAGRRVSLLDAFRRAMATLGVTGKIIATDVTSASAAFVRADLGLVVPSVGMLHYITTLLEIVEQHKIGLLVPLTDNDLRVLSRHRDKFAAIGCTVMAGSEESVMLCRDKVKTNNLLAKAGLSSIATWELKEFYKKPFYPCFMKPVRGSAGVGTGVIHNERELRGHVATFGDMLIVQEYVPGQEYTIDVYRSRDGVVRCVVPRQRLSVRSGEVEKGITIKDTELINAAVKLSGMLGDLWGVFCCQCRRIAGKPPRFFEVNPRFGGGSLLSIAAGANLPLYLLQEVLGLPITAKLGEFTDHLMMLRYDDAV